LIAICSATFMLLVDVTIVQVALPRIQRDLHASFTSLQLPAPQQGVSADAETARA
jgi:hypothetical protein